MPSRGHDKLCQNSHTLPACWSGPIAKDLAGDRALVPFFLRDPAPTAATAPCQWPFFLEHWNEDRIALKLYLQHDLHDQLKTLTGTRRIELIERRHLLQ